MGEILALWKSIVEFPLTSVKPGYYSMCWRFKCSLYLLGQVSCLHNATDLRSYITVGPGKSLQFAEMNVFLQESLLLTLRIGIVSLLQVRSRYAMKVKIQKHVILLKKCEESMVQICDTVTLSSWQVHLYLVMLSLVEVHNRAANYFKPTSPINNFRNTHTRNAYTQLRMSFTITYAFHVKWVHEPQELTSPQRKESQTRICSFKQAFPFSVGDDDVFHSRSLGDIMPLRCHDQHTLTSSQCLDAL